MNWEKTTHLYTCKLEASQELQKTSEDLAGRVYNEGKISKFMPQFFVNYALHHNKNHLIPDNRILKRFNNEGTNTIDNHLACAS